MSELLVTHSKNICKPQSLSKFLAYVAGNGILSLEGDQHRYIRKKSLAHFNVGSVKKLYPMMWSDACDLVKTLDRDVVQKQAGKTEISSLMEEITNRVIGETVLGQSFETAHDNKYEKLVKLIRVILQPDGGMQFYICLVVVLSIQMASVIMWKTGRTFTHTSAKVTAICLELVREKKEVLKAADPDDGDNDYQHVDLLSNMIRSQSFSDDDMASALLTYMIAGLVH